MSDDGSVPRPRHTGMRRITQAGRMVDAAIELGTVIDAGEREAQAGSREHD